MQAWPIARDWMGTALRHARSSLARGADLLYPPQCMICNSDCLAPLLLCTDCQAQIVDRTPACRRCGSNVPEVLAGGHDCGQCRQHVPRFDAVVRLGRYQGALRTAILRSKHEVEQPLARALARLLITERGADLQALAADVVLPIPMHWSRRLWRGTNNPDVLASAVAAHLRVPVAAHLLSRRRRTGPQTGLTRPRRRSNVRRAFRVHAHADLPGARVLLVDDVLTTGATANEAARMLRRAGAASVAVVVLARADGLG